MAHNPIVGITRGFVPFVKLLRAWKRLQVSYYGGKYSIHRVLALGVYTEKASWLRVLIVCLATPVPMIALVIIQESVPLQNPKEGWRLNYGFWVRAGILAFVVGHTLTRQATYLIERVTISERRLIVLTTCTSILFTACVVPVAGYFMFPIPFFVLTMSPIFYVLLVICFRVVIGRQTMYEMLRHRSQLIRYLGFVCTQTAMCFVYPAYEALFRLAAGSRHQLLVILLLPILKVAIKNVVLRCVTHMEDMMPEAVIFTVDFFNAIYVATCMQSATSTVAVTTITTTDLGQTMIMLYGLHRRTATISSRLRLAINATANSKNILTMLCILCRDVKAFEKQARAGIRIDSCLPHHLSTADKFLLDRLKRIQSQTQSLFTLVPGPSFPDKSSKSRESLLGKRIHAIHPIIPIAVKPQYPMRNADIRAENNRNPSRQNPAECATTLRESLESLFTIECLVVTAYLEAVIPFFYSCYVLVMVHLPNARYHMELVGVTQDNVGRTVMPVLVFGLLQIVSFVLLLMVIKRNCGMWALYQLAFVLETQMPLIQGKFMLWMVITICFRVVHFGIVFVNGLLRY